MKLKPNQRVKQLREYLGKTQQEFCNLTGITITSLSRIENDLTIPSRKTMEKIAGRTGVKEEWLIDGMGEFLVNSSLIQEYNKPVSDTPWREEAYANLKAEKEYFKRNYEKLLEILLSGKKPENLNFPKTSESAWMLNNNNIHSGVHASIQ